MRNAIIRASLAAVGLLAAAVFLKDFLLDTPDALTKRISPVAVESFGTWTHTYRIYYMSFIPVGTSTFTKRNADADRVYSVDTQAQGFLEDLLKANARLETRVDGATGLPFVFSEIMRTSNGTKSKEIDFDRENLLARSGEGTVRITGDVYDPLSAFVALLSRPLNERQKANFRFLYGNSIFILSARKARHINKISEIAVDISKDVSGSAIDASFTFWVSSDAPGIPLLFKSWTKAGYVTIILEKGEK